MAKHIFLNNLFVFFICKPADQHSGGKEISTTPLLTDLKQLKFLHRQYYNSNPMTCWNHV